MRGWGGIIITRKENSGRCLWPGQRSCSQHGAAIQAASRAKGQQGRTAGYQRTYPPLAAAGAGSIKIEAGAAGKVFKIEAQPGTAVKKGDAVLILEIMKMETPVVAPEDGTVASIEVAVGDSVEAGALLATMNN